MEPLDGSALLREGRAVVLAYDHGLEHGPAAFDGARERLDPESVFELATHDAVTAIAVGKGIAEACYPSYAESVGLVAKLNGASNLREGEPYSPKNWSVAYAADVGADAVGYTVYPGSNREPELFADFRSVQEAARERDLPVAMWAYPRGQAIRNHRRPAVVAYAARVALELGADLAKVKYPGDADGFGRAVEAAGPVAVLLSGGPKTDARAFLATVRSALDAGAAGVAVGRNVWRHDEPRRLLDALEAVVYDGASVEEAVAGADL